MPEFIECDDDRRVTRHKLDAVGNNVTAVLRWCVTHSEPVWVYGDDSYTCPHTRVVEYDTEDHRLVVPPWEGGDDA